MVAVLERQSIMAKRGLYANIHAKRKRIAGGSGEKMRKVGSKGAPTAANFARSAKTAKKKNAGGIVKGIKKIPSELKKASKMHAGQAKKVAKHIKAMGNSPKKKTRAKA